MMLLQCAAHAAAAAPADAFQSQPSIARPCLATADPLPQTWSRYFFVRRFYWSATNWTSRSSAAPISCGGGISL